MTRVKQGFILPCALGAIALSGSGAMAQEVAVPVTARIENPVVMSPGSGLTITGAMGLPLNPTAQIPNPGDIHIQGSYVDLGEISNDSDVLDFGPFGGVAPEDDEIGDFRFYGLHGATQIGRSRLELSGGVEKLRASGGKTVSGNLFGFPIDSNVDYDEMDRTKPAVGLKYLLTRNRRADAGHVAVGASYNPALFSSFSTYVVGTKPFDVGGRNVKLHLGARFDRFKFKSRLVSTIDLGGGPGPAFGTPINSDEESRKFSVYAGAELPLDKRGRFSLIGEIASKNSVYNDSDDERVNIAADLGLPRSKFPFSAAVRFNGGSIAGTVGVMRQGVTGDSSLFAQLGLTF